MDLVAQPSADAVAALGPAALDPASLAGLGPLGADTVAPLQTDPTGGGIFAVVVTFLLTAAFYAVTLHLAATFFIGDVPSQRAAYVGPVPAAVSILLGRYGVESIGFVSPALGIVIVLLATLVADAIAISVSYRVSWRPAAILTALHFAFAAVLGFALNNIFGFF
ncbi:hypothetical protein C475_03369 [Halosimplex carlsbadense 2-9-1]|uniref:Yip1 domain-containing protein n=1 Tax=Halosimplex carlsbadense 2-9-1 TaxID=797114 RepID=M0D4W9_9EURY|nr:hypothetical protein C475_03369 [Halosimplex carlsbadense 2-9-1]